MKRLFIGTCVLAALLVMAFVVFVAGVEFGHRWGYDEGWRDCKFDAKETLYPRRGDPFYDSFWKWHGSTKSIIRKRRGIFE